MNQCEDAILGPMIQEWNRLKRSEAELREQLEASQQCAAVTTRERDELVKYKTIHDIIKDTVYGKDLTQHVFAMAHKDDEIKTLKNDLVGEKLRNGVLITEHADEIKQVLADAKVMAQALKECDEHFNLPDVRAAVLTPTAQRFLTSKSA